MKLRTAIIWIIASNIIMPAIWIIIIIVWKVYLRTQQHGFQDALYWGGKILIIGSAAVYQVGFICFLPIMLLWVFYVVIYPEYINKSYLVGVVIVFFSSAFSVLYMQVDTSALYYVPIMDYISFIVPFWVLTKAKYSKV